MRPTVQAAPATNGGTAGATASRFDADAGATERARQQLEHMRQQARFLRERIGALQHAGGHAVSAAHGGVQGGRALEQAWVDEAAQAANGVLHLAEHDPLTGLPNRLLLYDRIEQAIESGRRHIKRLAVVFLDLDGFKAINDSAGHAVGDELLRHVGSRLTASVRSSDTVSRHGGDEFVILLSEIEHAEDAAVSAAKMIDAIGAPYAVGAGSIDLGASVGISVYPDDAADPQSLIEMADVAMYRAKQGGRRSYQFFSRHDH